MWSLIRRLFSAKEPEASPPPRTKRIGSISTIHPSSTTSIWANLPYLPDFHFYKPKSYVYIYNASEESFEAGNSTVKRLEIPGREPRKRYRYITSFPDVVTLTKPDADAATFITTALSGVRLAVDLISPDNLTSDLDAGPRPEACLSIGRDLSKRGVFYSLSKPPKKKDLEAAEKRLAKFHQDVFDQARALYWGTGKAPEGDFGRSVALAAKYLGITQIPWKSVKKAPKESR